MFQTMFHPASPEAPRRLLYDLHPPPDSQGVVLHPGHARVLGGHPVPNAQDQDPAVQR